MAAKCVLDFGFFFLPAIHLPSAELSFQCCSETRLPGSLRTAGCHHLFPFPDSAVFDSAGALLSFVLQVLFPGFLLPNYFISTFPGPLFQECWR